MYTPCVTSSQSLRTKGTRSNRGSWMPSASKDFTPKVRPLRPPYGLQTFVSRNAEFRPFEPLTPPHAPSALTVDLILPLTTRLTKAYMS